MQFYKKKESFNLLPKIFECYISCSVIFPNYVILPESKYIYKNIKKKQRVIDIQQEQEDREENIKNGLYEQEKEPTIFTTQAFDSILNQTDTNMNKKKSLRYSPLKRLILFLIKRIQVALNNFLIFHMIKVGNVLRVWLN